MKFIGNVLEDMFAFSAAILILMGVLVIFGTNTIERQVCELATTNVVDQTTCTLHYALDGN